ncbi:hypothetical protein ACHAXR_012438 [Thalassiosira sp. AJA248-18]
MPASGSESTMANNLLLEMGMPRSICQLVHDLIDAGSDSCSSSAPASVDEALWDLTQMKTNPQSFLFDCMCPKKALDTTRLFGNADEHLFGRDGETSALMVAKNKILAHVHMEKSNSDSFSSQGDIFLCESAFLHGYPGSGKSALLHSLITVCNDEQWFVLGCKFDKKAAPHMILSKAFDDFFGKYGRSNEGIHYDEFNGICRHIFSTVDSDGFDQLCDILPNFARIFPLLANGSKPQDQGARISSMDKVGSAQKRLQNLFHIILKSLCSAGRPVLFTLDDLQWSESSVMDFLAEYVVSRQDASEVPRGACRQGILIAGTYRSNAVNKSDDFIESIGFLKDPERDNVTMLAVGELAQVDINLLISTRLCLPLRYTRELAGLVAIKTRGNPFFVIQFLRCIVQNKMVWFSAKSHRWIWDNDTVDMQMISDGVAELLTTTFSQLPFTLMQTMKIVSCLGSQVEESTIDALNARNEVLSFDMHEELPSAVKEGIMEKAGPVYQFTHDIIQQTVYDLIPATNRILLHKTLGKALLKSASNNPTTHLLATFDDSLKASSLLVKLLASNSKFEEARSNCLSILSSLGEVFPSEVSLPLVLNELSVIETSLRSITFDQMRQLPPMTDRKKLNAMQFLNMLCMYSVISKPMLLPLLSCRMVKLMMEYGMCNDGIVGLVTAGYSLFLFTEDIPLASTIGRVSELLVDASPERHVLRSRVCNELYTTLKMIEQPWHAVVALYPGLYKSAMLSGDVENAMICRWSYISAGYWVAAMDLDGCFKHLLMCIKEVAKYKQNAMLYNTMALFHSCSCLSGRSDHDIELKSLDELNDIGEKTNSAFLVWQTFMIRMSTHFWMREYMAVAEISEKHSEKHPSSQQKRILHVLRCFYEGLAYCSLARDTKEVKWRILSRNALINISQFEITMSKYNFENKSKLLQAEFHYLDGDLESAESAYKASIKSACTHNFIHEEALAYELYGFFCVENNMIGKGSEQFHIAVDKYKTWGAMKKAENLQHFIEDELDYSKWISDRKQAEEGHALTVLLPQPAGAETESADDGVMDDAPKVSQGGAKGSVTAASSCSSTAPPMAPSPPACTPEEGTAKPSAAGNKRRGNKGDSRMNRAVTLKMDNNDVSLVEALQNGGFNFRGLNEAGRPHHKVFDQDDVSLVQRKNQLLRRIRLEKKKKKDEEGCD